MALRPPASCPAQVPAAFLPGARVLPLWAHLRRPRSAETDDSEVTNGRAHSWLCHHLVLVTSVVISANTHTPAFSGSVGRQRGGVEVAFVLSHADF